MQKRPIYQFNIDTEVGLDKIPNGSLISCLNVAGATKSFQLSSKAGVTSATTIAQAIASGNLKEAGGALTSYKFTATEGQTAFVTTGSTLSADPLVYANGVLQDLGVTYTVASKTVTFIDARTVNEKIVIVG